MINFFRLNVIFWQMCRGELGRFFTGLPRSLEVSRGLGKKGRRADGAHVELGVVRWVHPCTIHSPLAYFCSRFFYIPCIVKIKKKKIVGPRFRKWVVTKSDYYLVRKSVTDKLWQPITRENNVFFRNSTQSPWTIAKLLCRSTVYFAENFAEKAFVFSDDFMFYLVDFRIV